MFEATWDFTNDWSNFTQSGLGTEVELTRLAVASPVPFVGGCGRMRTTWGSGAGFLQPYVKAKTDAGTGRQLRCSYAMRVTSWNFGAASVAYGPGIVRCRNNAAASLGSVFMLAGQLQSGKWRLGMLNTLNGDVSPTTMPIHDYLGEWLVFDWHLESTGSSAPYTTTCYVDVWVEGRNGGLRFITRLQLADYSGAVYDFSEHRLGFEDLGRNVDNFDLQFDEYRVSMGTSVGVPLPRQSSKIDADYRARARIRKYDAATGTWFSVLDIEQAAISGLNCSFLAHRVEDRCTLEITDQYRYWSTKTRDILAQIEKDVGSYYRLDIFAPDESVRDLTLPSGWNDDPIFWSGLIKARDGARDLSARGVRIEASGFTELLKLATLTSKRYFRSTVRTILTDVVTTAAARWPGALSLVTRANGFDNRIEIRETSFPATSVADALDELAKYGSFFWGVSASGYPGYERLSTSEFRLVFLEPHVLAEGQPDAGDLGFSVGLFVDTENDRRVTTFDITQRDDRYANSWLVEGSRTAVDLIGVVTGSDSTRLRDSITVASASAVSGLYAKILDTPIGMNVEIIATARRSLNYVDPETGEVFPAGKIDRVPQAMREPIGGAVFVITSFSEGATDMDFFLDQWPAPEQNLASDYTNQALLYRVDTADIRILRRVIDAEANGATGRERVEKILRDDEARGWYQAGVFAMNDRWAQVWERDEAKLVMTGFRRFPTGSRYQDRNLVAISTGAERLTILGTTAAGGDNWARGDDERPVGMARIFEVRSVSMSLRSAGWDAIFILAASPRALASVFETKDVEILEGRS